METWCETEPNIGKDHSSNAHAERDWLAEGAADQTLQLYAEDGVSGNEEKQIVQRRLSAAAHEKILELYDEYRPKLYRYMRSMHLGCDHADEIIQETFMRLTIELLKDNEIENVQGWIVRVAHNLAVTFQKRQRRSLVPSEGIDFMLQNRVDPSLSPEEAYSNKEQFRTLHAALSKLNPQHRQCFQMRAQGLRYKDIGLALGVSEQRAAFLVKQVAVRLAAICD